MSEDYRGDQWVHERDYGSFSIGGILLGIIEIVAGLVGLVYFLFKKDE